jgi:quercetin 2,3-dioxygenase
MTGPVAAATIDVHASRESVVGRMRVRRALPRRGLRTVGPWCFADHMGPEQVTPSAGLDIGPHPHIGLHTVTWLVDGAVLHKDSLGSEQVIRPGQLNLMTAGRGVVHSEEAVDTYQGTLHGVQLWVAQPDGPRDGDAGFEHHATLPQVELDRATATVLVGELAGTRSSARTDSELLGVEVVLPPGRATFPLRADFEHALVVVEGAASVGSHVVEPGSLGYLRAGISELPVDSRDTTRFLLLGGRPFEEPLIMWWNFVARSRAEVDAAYRAWQDEDERFGRVVSSLPRIPAPDLLWAPRG